MKKNKDEYINSLRHSCAHLLAAAVTQLWPGSQNAIGPAIHNGFYQDFDMGDIALSEKDFPKIQNKMRELIKTWDSFDEKETPPKDAKKVFDWNIYKQEMVDDIVERGEKVKLQISGDFTDLCRGGHINKPKEEIKYFKLLSIAGAYWKGDIKNTMLTRIYGTCFLTSEELKAHLTMLEEAKKRDHKILGAKLGLFSFSDLVGPGLPLWSPKGTIMREELDNFIWHLRKEKGYERVTIPHITKKELYEVSGHWDKFKDELFKIVTREEHEFAMKPMNCPHHTQIFASEPRSYRDMPVRYAETTACYRDEQTGELSGLSRTRAFTQDDAHVFARKAQIKDEFLAIWDIVDTFYSVFGFELDVRLSLHDPDNFEAYLGDQNVWLEAEEILRSMAKERMKNNFNEEIGEAAFYGPKIDFVAKDSLQREWQVATIQLDINMPDRFDLTCMNEKGDQERIFMIHAAIMGSTERFMSILIEHYAGAFPAWLAPIQVVILPISEKYNDTAILAKKFLYDQDIRVVLDDDNKTLPAKVRKWTLQKVPYMCIIGEKESQKSNLRSQTSESRIQEKQIYVSVRTCNGKDMGMTSLYEFIQKIKNDIERKII